LPPRLVRLDEFLKGFPKDSWEHGIGEWNWILVEPRPLATPLPKYGQLRIWQPVVVANPLRLGNRPEPYVGPFRTAYPNPSAAKLGPLGRPRYPPRPQPPLGNPLSSFPRS
jgi:hypothetical protein